MVDSTLDDVYDDPDNILADDDDDVSGAVELPDDQKDDPSQSIFVPEKNNTSLDDRGPIDELEEADDSADNEVHDEMDEEYPEDTDPDSLHLGDMDTADEKDGTES